MRVHITAKCHRWKDPKFDDHAKQLHDHGLRGDHSNKDGIGKTFEGYIRDIDVFRYMIKGPEWDDWWTFIYD